VARIQQPSSVRRRRGTNQVIGRSMQRWHRAGLQTLLAASVVAGVAALPSGVGSAATVSDSASTTVTLDAPGTLPLDQFNPALGTLMSVQLSVTADALVQVCIENTSAQSAATAGSAASGTLDASFPGSSARAVATAQANGAAATLTASNGTDNCAGGFDTAAGRFPAPVSAGDVTYFEHSIQATNSATLSDSAQLAPFIGTGTVAVSYTTQNDTELVVPAEWQNTAVARGQLQASVTYTYVEPGGDIPATGNSSYRTATIAIIAVLVGVAALLLAKRRRVQKPVS
ncbi:MAG TPA: choice-of-anchor E domain-containing protein, partial [Ilumatobacter sp.]|nr:choice-of-anchor E domain-containing protein [Ilumatobacter sp.]